MRTSVLYENLLCVALNKKRVEFYYHDGCLIVCFFETPKEAIELFERLDLGWENITGRGNIEVVDYKIMTWR